MWLVSIPAWGEHYIEMMLRLALPALCDSAKKSSVDKYLVVHTEPPEHARITAATHGFKLVWRSVPKSDSPWEARLSEAHREVMRMAGARDYVMLLTADTVLSPEVFVACEARFMQGTRMVGCCGLRVEDDGIPPIRSSSRAMLDWGWNHRHQLTRETTYPDGKCGNWTGVYFEDGDQVIFRPRYVHPIAAMSYGHGTNFCPTIDAGYIGNFHLAQVHVVTDPDEMAILKLSRPDKPLDFIDPPFSVRVSDRKLLMEHHSFWLMQHKVIIRGDGNCYDQDILQKVVVRGWESASWTKIPTPRPYRAPRGMPPNTYVPRNSPPGTSVPPQPLSARTIAHRVQREQLRQEQIIRRQSHRPPGAPRS